MRATPSTTVTRAVVAVAVATVAVTAAVVGGGRSSAQAPPPAPAETATVTSDGRTLDAPATNRRGTDGAAGRSGPDPSATDVPTIGPLSAGGAQSILGPDNRKLVADTTAKPARMVALMTLAGNQWCTGFMISADTLVTTGHCVYDIATNAFLDPSQIAVYPGYDSTRANPAPYGGCSARLLLSTVGWTVSHSDEYDYGAVKLACTIGQQTGWFGWWYQTASLNGTQSRNTGYPGDKPLTQWKSTDTIRVSEPRRLYYANDTYGGNSGSPIFTRRRDSASACGGWCVMAVHGYGTYGAYPTSSYNHGVRITKEVSDTFFAWRAL
jgi:glutamyl endopeptidase